MSTPLKVGLVLLVVIFAVLAVFLVIGMLKGDDGTDKNNSNVNSSAPRVAWGSSVDW